jgi:hypothetical protein
MWLLLKNLTMLLSYNLYYKSEHKNYDSITEYHALCSIFVPIEGRVECKYTNGMIFLLFFSCVQCYKGHVPERIFLNDKPVTSAGCFKMIVPTEPLQHSNNTTTGNCIFTQHHIWISNSMYEQPESDTQSKACSLHSNRKVKNQHNPDSAERSQYAVTSHHNYHYHS